MPAYDDTFFEPPAPIARVALRNRETGAECSEIPMLVDSGADVTLVPDAAVDQLGLTVVPDKQYELVAFDGTISFASMVVLELGFCRRTFRGQFLLTDQPWGVLVATF